MKIITILFAACLIAILLWYFKKKRMTSNHLTKPILETEKPISDSLINALINSDYAKGLDDLKVHVEGHKVINSDIGNAGFILYLDNNSRASAFRSEDKISFEYGVGVVPEESVAKINSTSLGERNRRYFR